MKNLVLTISNKYFTQYTLIALCLLSIISWFIFYQNGLTTAYNDAMSHLNLSRMVMDNKEPGLAQIGGVWLPLTHIFPLLLIWNDWAWQSGFAGSFFSMISYVVSAIFIYKIVKNLTLNTLGALIGAVAFALNLNILYLQSTPMTEPMYIMFFILSAHFFISYIQTKKTKFLVLLGIIGFFQVLTRYDGWFVVGLQGLAVLIYEFNIQKKSFSETVGKLFLLSFPVIFGVSVWLLWNAVIFGDPLFFAVGPYSAREQQNVINEASGLITKHNIVRSTVAYFLAIFANVGMSLFTLSVLGIIFFFVKLNKKINRYKKLIILFFLSGPLIFNVLALFLGFSIINLPDLNWNPSNDPGGKWFNVRYGILALPMIAVFIGIFASWRKLAAVIAIELVLLQMVLMYPTNIITITDGTIGSSSYRYEDVSDILKNNVNDSDTLLLSISYYNPVAFKSSIQLKQVVHEGVSKEWSDSLNYPEKNNIDWIVMANGDIGEPAYTTLIKNQKNRFAEYYELFYKGKHANIYKAKSPASENITLNK